MDDVGKKPTAPANTLSSVLGLFYLFFAITPRARLTGGAVAENNWRGGKYCNYSSPMLAWVQSTASDDEEK